MSAQQIDEALSLWKDRLNAAAQNLMDVQSHPVYKRISDPDTQLCGETAEKSALAVRTLGWLLQYFDLLQGVIARAEDLRRDMPAIFGAEEREREISALLQGRSIQLPSVQIPLGQRSLVGGIENSNTISPRDLLTTMESAFEQTKQIVLQLDAAWEALGRSLDELSQELTLLRSESEHLTPQDRATLDGAAKQLELMHQSASEDPLGSAAQVIAGVNQTLAKLTAKLDQLRRDLAQMAHDLAAAHQLLTAVKNGHSETLAICQEACEKTDCQIDLATSHAKLEGIVAWLNRLETASLNGAAPASVLIGLRNWMEAARQVVRGNQEIAVQARAQVAVRSELRGRLDALKAKARAFAVAENDDLAAIAEQAKTLLYQRPTPLKEAAAFVAEYERTLNTKATKLV